MWATLIPKLRAQMPELRIKAVSLYRYYGQSPKTSLDNLGADCLEELERSWGNQDYWRVSWFDKLLMVLDIRFHLHAMLRKDKPALVVVGNDIGLVERILIRTAKKFRIPTLLVQDGILRRKNRLPDPLETHLKEVFFRIMGISPNRIYGLGGTTSMAVMGQFTYDLLKDQGRDMQDVFITGQPRFDKYAESLQAEGGRDHQIHELRRELNIPPARSTVGFFTQPLIPYGLMKADHWDRIVQSIFTTTRFLNPKVFTLVKLHPAETVEAFRSRYLDDPQGPTDVLLLEGDFDLKKILQLVDIVIVHSSTVALEAILLDKPVIFFDPYGFEDDYGLIEAGAALHASTISELAHFIKVLMEESETLANMKAAMGKVKAYHAGPMDGLAATRVAGLIIDCLLSVRKVE
jgi:hypothetical protein